MRDANSRGAAPLPVLALILGCLALHDARAVTPLDSAELGASCSAYLEAPDSAPGTHCAHYLTGFLDGAVVTDERVAMNIAAEIEKDESWGRRALRTRVGGHIRRRGVSSYAEYCISDPVPVRDVAQLVVDELAAAAAASERLARDIVYTVLRTHFPCPAPAP